jgi:hypothetical protein
VVQFHLVLFFSVEFITSLFEQLFFSTFYVTDICNDNNETQ